MELHVLAMIGCVGFDMIKHVVEMFRDNNLQVKVVRWIRDLILTFKSFI